MKQFMLDEKGRCHGRKPLVYKRPVFHQFCFRCNRCFDAKGCQIESHLWFASSGGFYPVYPDQDYAKV